jgi:hypothetical protein
LRYLVFVQEIVVRAPIGLDIRLGGYAAGFGLVGGGDVLLRDVQEDRLQLRFELRGLGQTWTGPAAASSGHARRGPGRRIFGQHDRAGYIGNRAQLLVGQWAGRQGLQRKAFAGAGKVDGRHVAVAPTQQR